MQSEAVTAARGQQIPASPEDPAATAHATHARAATTPREDRRVAVRRSLAFGVPPTGDAVTPTLIRVELVDRPGALGQVASRIGSLRGDIVSIDVVEQCDGRAIDEFVVHLPTSEVIPTLIREIHEVDGVTIEQIRILPEIPEGRIEVLDAATAICEAETASLVAQALAAHSLMALAADWSVVMCGEQLVTSAGDIEMPMSTLIQMAQAEPAPDMDATLATSATKDVAFAALPAVDGLLMVARADQIFRLRERQRLASLARIANRTISLLGGFQTTDDG